ncbi:hypothetical protein Btru_042896 [Bulinus truncatus]|nr:hypothetical protein Btru_042896 [Bulinus truncatus]
MGITCEESGPLTTQTLKPPTTHSVHSTIVTSPSVVDVHSQSKIMIFFVVLLPLIGLTVGQKINSTSYGNVNCITPKGKKNGGVAASNYSASIDIPYINRYRACYKTVADKYGLQTSLLAAIASRESRSGYLIEATKGYGRGGQAYGIMQCDLKRSGLPCTSVPWNSCAHIDMMTGRALVPYIRQVAKKRPTWPPVRQLQGGCSAYNTYGNVNLNSVDYLDVGTTDGDYSNDVYARAQYYYSRGYR